MAQRTNVLCLRFDENDIEQCIRASREPREAWNERVGTVALHCTLQFADGTEHTFVVDAAAPVCADCVEPNNRTFYYLNGLLRALRAVRLKHRTVRALELHTDRSFLLQHVNVPRIGNWRKRGFKRADGSAIALRSLWINAYEWLTSPAVGFQLTCRDSASKKRKT